MPEPLVIDSHVHVGRNESRWETVRPSLEAVGIDTAVLSADPESYDLRGDRSIGGDLARPGGPFGLWYISGNPFGGYRLAEPLLPRSLDDYDGVDWHCWFSDAYDYGSSDALAEAQALLDSADACRALEALEALFEAGLPVRLTESLPFTLALIELFPSARFIIPHMGLRNGGCARVLNALAESPRVYFDTSVVQPNEGMVRTVGAHRVLFGSDTPTGDLARAIREVRSLDLPPGEIEAILGGNAQRLFGAPVLQPCQAQACSRPAAQEPEGVRGPSPSAGGASRPSVLPHRPGVSALARAAAPPGQDAVGAPVGPGPGGDDPVVTTGLQLTLIDTEFGPTMAEELRAALRECSEAAIAVAFVSVAGLKDILEEIRGLIRRGASLRLLTGTYQAFTEPKALSTLVELVAAAPDGALQVRIARASPGFHKKVYLFWQRDRCTAYVGSTNLTAALRGETAETSVRIEGPRSDALLQNLSNSFEADWAHSGVPTPAWIERYEKARKLPERRDFTFPSPPPTRLAPNALVTSVVTGHMQPETAEAVEHETGWKHSGEYWYEEVPNDIYGDLQVGDLYLSEERRRGYKRSVYLGRVMGMRCVLDVPDGPYFVACQKVGSMPWGPNALRELRRAGVIGDDESELECGRWFRTQRVLDGVERLFTRPSKTGD